MRKLICGLMLGLSIGSCIGLPLVMGGGIQTGGGLGSSTIGTDYLKPGILIYKTDGTVSAPQATLAAAKAAASSGQTVVVPPGSYSISSSLAKDGVNWWFAPGANVSYSDSGANGCIFDDGGTAMTFKVGGMGNFTRTIAGVTSDFTGIVRCGHASSDIQINADVLTSNGSGTVTKNSTVACTAGKLVVNCNKMVGGGTINNVLWWTNGEMEVNCNYIDGSTGVGYVLYTKTDAAMTGDLHVRCHNILGTLSTNGTVAGAVWIDTHLYTGAIILSGGLDGSTTGKEKVYITAQKLVMSGGGFQQSDGILYILGYPKVSGDLTDNTTAYFSNSAGTAYITISQVDPGTSGNIVVQSGGSGTTFVDAIDLTAASASTALKCGTGTLNLLSGKITTSGGGLDLQRTGGTLNVGPGANFTHSNTSGLITGIGSAPYTQKTTTTNNTQTTAMTVTIPASTTVAVEAHVYARRTGGSAGTAEDGAYYICRGVIKNVAGTATFVANPGSATVTILGEDQAGWDATLDVTGATARVRVTGATNNNISWVVDTFVKTISS